MAKTALEKIAEREQAAGATAERIKAQIDALTGQLRDLDAELADLATARKVLLSLGDDEPAHPQLPDNPVYQQVLTVLADATEPVRAKDLCRALDLGTEAKHIEAMRDKLKRLTGHGLIVQTEPGLFTLRRE